MTRKIAIPVVDRANFGRLLPVMQAIQEHPDLEMQVIASGTTLLDRFGRTEKQIIEAGFNIDSRVYVELEGGRPVTMAKSLGFCVIEAATALNNLQPDVVLLIGDRYEALGFAMAAAYQNIPLAHIQGGEISGSIDESARHAISKFAQYHFPSTDQAARILLQLGERPDTVFNYGCPVGDLILRMDPSLPENAFSSGVGAPIDASDEYALVIFHPVTTSYENQESECLNLLHAMQEIQMPTIWLWPNIDAGGDTISRVLRSYRETDHENRWLRMVKGFNPSLYQKVLFNASIAIGNSSSFLRDTSFMGTPVVLVGDRQQTREHAKNVVRTNAKKLDIEAAVEMQRTHGRYPISQLYGDGTAGPRIAQKLAEMPLYVQKKLCIMN